MFRRFKDIVTALAFLALLALIALKVNDERPEQFGGAFRVVDGDSVSLGSSRMRLWGVDAPELNQTCQRGGENWACGRAAKQALLSQMQAEGVVCEGAQRDKYQRLLVVCRAGGADINAALVRMGMAVSFGGYGAEEKQAEAARIGLWAGSFDKPQDWRRAHKHAMADEAAHQSSFVARLFGMP